METRSFRLQRFFSLTSLVVTVLAALVLILVYRELSFSSLVQSAERHNLSLAQVYCHALWPRFERHVREGGNLSPELLRRRPEVAEFRRAVIRHTENMPVLEIKIFNLQGRTMLAGDDAQIGVLNERGYRARVAAETGETISELNFRERISGIRGTAENRHVLSSYLPIRPEPQGAIEAVLEVYTDVTALVDGVHQTIARLTVAVSATLAALYAILFAVVHFANRFIVRQVEERGRTEHVLRMLYETTATRAGDFIGKTRAVLELLCRHFELAIGLFVRTELDGHRILCAVDPDGKYREGDLLPADWQSNPQADPAPPWTPERLTGQRIERREFQRAEPEAKFGIPVIVRGEVYGVLRFGSRERGSVSFTNTDRELLKLIAQWLAREIERVQAEARERAHREELARVAKLNTLGAMAAGCAHELGQPLSAILTYAEGVTARMDRGAIGDAVLDEVLRAITRQARRAAEVIDRLRGMVNNVEPARTAVNLNELACETAALVEPQAAQHRVKIQFQMHEGLPPVFADKIQIQQVIVNLLLNAIEAMAGTAANKRDLVLRTARYGDDEVEFAVTDSGKGIPARELPRVFEPFFSTRAKGMGLGLAISRAIIEAHFGRVWVESTPGIKTTFYFVLPAYVMASGQARRALRVKTVE